MINVAFRFSELYLPSIVILYLFGAFLGISIIGTLNPSHYKLVILINENL